MSFAAPTHPSITRSSAVRFIVALGLISLLADFTYEGARSITGPFLGSLGASAAGASPDADLELAGEKYLYGNGVPHNCARAESSLRTAAMHGNSKAETVLGTMYATGHCVGRDLPSAYRWFARALHEEPQNSRISADLQVLWRQMTPQEKQLATNRGQ